jgi:DNA-binding CsgD family transcriptional regulator
MTMALPISENIASGPTDLTAAEREVASLAAAGLTDAAIARRRGRSARTVANQMASIRRKLRVCSRREVASRLAAWSPY